MLHYLIFAGAGLFGAGVATAYWLPIVRGQDADLKTADTRHDALATNCARAFKERNAAIRDHQALKAKYDQPRVGGKFAKKREGVS